MGGWLAPSNVQRPVVARLPYARGVIPRISSNPWTREFQSSSAVGYLGGYGLMHRLASQFDL